MVNAFGRGANARGAAVRSARDATGVLGSRRRREALEAAIDEARTRLAHATAGRNFQLIVDSTASPSSALIVTLL